MRLRRLVVTSVAAATTAIVLQPAHGAPYNGEYRFATGVISLNGADGAVWEVGFEIVTPGTVGTGNVQRLKVEVDRCGYPCQTMARWEQPITADNTIPDDLGTANVTAKAAGTTFSLHLTADDSYLASHTGIPVFAVDWPTADVGRLRLALGTVSIGRVACKLLPSSQVGEIGVVEAVNAFAQTDTAPPRSLPKGLFTGGKHKVGCGY